MAAADKPALIGQLKAKKRTMHASIMHQVVLHTCWGCTLMARLLTQDSLLYSL